MNNVALQVKDLQQTSVDAAVRFARSSVDKAERLMALNIETTKASIDEANKIMGSISSIKDAQDMDAVRANIAESSLEYAVGYSRTIGEMASHAQAEYAQLVEERIAEFRKSVSDGLAQIAKAAPAGSDSAFAALISNLAATNSALDGVTQALKQAATYTDATIKAATSQVSNAAKTAAAKNVTAISASPKRAVARKPAKRK